MQSSEHRGEHMEGGAISRERLIQAGMRELEDNGLEGFSLRRVAQRCGVSCAAPYRHFKDKNALIQAMAAYYNRRWAQRQAERFAGIGDDVTRLLQETCKEYLRFLLDNPYFSLLVTHTDSENGKWYLTHLFDGTTPTKKLIETYCKEHNMPAETAHIKIILLRGLLFGVTMMVASGELTLNEESLQMLYHEMNTVFLS